MANNILMKKQPSQLKIESYRDEVLNSASIDLEWLSYQGKYEHSKTQIFAGAFCTNWGERIVLHISKYKYKDQQSAEKALIKDILYYFEQFPLTFGWYTTGVAVYDDQGNRIQGRDSDFFILHQRCLYYNLESPFELSYNNTYMKTRKDFENKHIDLIKVFEKQVIKDNVFEGKYRTTGLDSVSSALLGITKYDNINAGTNNILEISEEDQKKYVKRDAELAMLLAQYNNCLVLRLMKVFSKYAEMDYYQVCNTNVSSWYANRYKKMIERKEILESYSKVEKQKISGGHHTTPKKGFFINSKVYELDVKGMYPSLVINKNISFDTLNCSCCQYDPTAWISKDTIDTINQGLQENKIDREVSRYWICLKRKGAFPIVLEQVLSDREHYLQLLKKEKNKINPNHILVEEYQTHQIGAKLFANAGFGLFANEYFEFSNYKVAECITGEGRRIHKSMEALAQNEPFNFEIVFGFTDSIFVKAKDGNNDKENAEKLKMFIDRCKKELGITVELKNEFQNSIFYGKKNRFVAWSGKEADQPIIKGLDGLADSNPLWIRKWFYKVVYEIIRPDTGFNRVSNLLQNAVFELEHEIKSPNIIEEQLKCTQKLKKHPDEYSKTVRSGILGRLLGKDKGQEVWSFEIKYKDKLTGGNFSTNTPIYEDLNLEYYKRMLLDKLNDTLEIAGYDIKDIRLKILDKIMPITFY